MSGSTANSRPSAGFFLYLILAAAAVGIFILPWYVPVAEPNASDSYRYGFNNSVAILAVGVSLGALFVRLLLRRGKTALPGLLEETLALDNPAPANRGLLQALFLSIVAFCGFNAALFWFTPFFGFAEMNYFRSRLEMFAIHRLPYSQFAFLYGPAMLTLPYRLYTTAHGLLSLEQAYLTILLLHWMVGLCLVAYCVRLLVPAARQVIVYWVIALVFFNPMLGCNYTPLRFTLPLAALLFTHRAVFGSGRRGIGSHLLAALTAFLGTFANFEFSPEMGLAVTVTLVIYSAALLRTPRRAYAYCGVAALVGAAAAVLPWGLDYMHAIFSYGGGGALPILPGPGMLMFLAAAFLLLPGLAVLGISSRGSQGVLGIALCTLSGILIIPSLSHCDMPHLAYNGLPIFIVGAAALARLNDLRWFKGAVLAYFLMFGVIAEWPFLFHFGYSFKEALADRAQMRVHPVPAPAPTNIVYYSKPFPLMQGLEPLLAYGPIAAPLGCTQDIERFLIVHGQYVVGCHSSNQPDVFVMKDVERTIQDLKDFHTILVPKRYFAPGPPPDEDADDSLHSKRIRHLLLFPAKLVPLHPLFQSDWMEMPAVKQQFVQIAEFRDYVIMVRRSGEGHEYAPALKE
jgi:hypothetical protein